MSSAPRLAHLLRQGDAPQADRPGTARRPLRRSSHRLSLEQRFMFDGAAVADAAHAAAAASALAQIPHVPAAVEVRAADPSKDGGKKEAVIVDTSLADYKTLEAGVRDGMAIVEFDGSQNGLAQIARWAEVQSGYDAIHILSHGTEGTLELGSAFVNDAALQSTGIQAELAEIGHALNRGGDLLLYGCDIAAGSDGQQFVHDLSSATGADVAASTDLTGSALKGGNWVLESQVGHIEAASLDLGGYDAVLGNVITGNDPGAAYVNTNTIAPSAPVDLAQSFTATKTGLLTTLTLYGSLPSGSATLNIYSGDGTGGALLESQTLSPFNVSGTADTGNQRYIGTSFTLNTALSITNGNHYTFQIVTNDGISLTYTNNTDYAGGTLYDTGVDQGSSYDLEFSVTQADAGPVVTDSHIAITSSGTGTGGAYKIGDTVTAAWNNTAGGDNNAGVNGVTMDFSQFGGGSAVAATNSSGTWTASYTIVAGSVDATNRNVSVSATTGSGTTTAADTTNLTVDNIAPTVTDAKISISGASGTGGAYKIGDTVTATWNNTAGGDNNADTISGATVDFSQFGGGSAVSATNSSGTWTATYTIVAGSVDATNRNISVTATDNAGNTKTTADTTNATVDNIAPTLTDSNISLSGASGTGGAYKIGDTVTATWNNTASGDNNADSLSGVTVDFSQFGGGSAVSASNSSGTWTATYTLVAGAINGTANRNVSVTATDNAGNTKTTADTTNATVDNVAPTITFSGVALSSDTGSSSADFITASAAQTITATLSGAPGAGDIVYGSLDNGATWTDITSKVSGTTLAWDGVTLTGSSTLKLKVTDAAGNDGTAKSQAYVLDTTAPSAPSTPDMSSGTDTGTSSSDNLTRNTTPTFTGSAESGSTVTLYDTDGVTVLGTGTATGGNWSITSSSLSSGSHTITAKATDAAGNVSTASSGLAVTIDTAAPTGLGLDHSTIATQNATSTSTIATLSSTDASTVTYSLAAGNGTNDADNGSFTISGTSLQVGASSLAAGTYKVYVAATDAAGNVAHQAFTLTIVDAPSVSSIVRSGGASATVAGSASSVSYTVTFSESVTGVDATDFALTATGTASGSIASVSGSGATYTVTIDTLSGDGTLRLDLNGSGTGIQNGSSVAIASGYTSGAAYTLDHTPPNAPSTPDMTSGTDTGASSSDNLTGNATPTFTGTAESGSTVTLYDTDGTTVLGTGTATGGNWSITSATLSEGSHTVTAKSTDAAGNTSSASSGLAVTVDTAAPTVASVSVPSNGSYKAGQTLSFTVDASEAVIVDTGGGTPRIALTIGSSTVYASYASGSGSSALVFSYTVQAGDTDADGIAIGALQANGGTLKDSAGNSMALTLNSVGSTAAVLVDTTAPVVNSVSVPADGTYFTGQNLDFSVDFSEAVTVDSSGGAPRIALTLDTGGTVYADYVSGSGTPSLVFRHVVAGGELDSTGITVGALGANGSTLRDAAGNDATLTLNSVGSTAAVNVDGSQPQVTSVGATSADGFYKAGDTVSVTVSFDKAVAVDTSGGTPTLALADGGLAHYVSGSGSSTLVFAYTVSAGENSADLDYGASSSLALNGATIRDAGGSHQDAVLTLAAPGAAGSLGANKNIVVDTTPPSTTFGSLALSADTGTSSTDFLTKTAAQTVTATLSGPLGAGDVVYGSLDNGATWTDVTAKVSGTTLSWTGVTLAASSTLKLKVTDAAGNDGTVASQAYVLDSTAPGAPSAPDMSAASDTGASNSDHITRNTTPTFTGTAEAGSTVTLYDSDGSTVLGSTVATGGAWSITTATLSEGSHTVAAKATDAAGNVSAASSGLVVAIDTTAPSAVATARLSADTGTSSSDFLTRTAAQTVSGTLASSLAAGETVYVSLDNGSTWTAAAAATGQNTWSLAGQTLAGSGTLKVKVTDAAGNDGAVYSQAYVLDTTPPSATFGNLALSADTGTSSTDFLTKTAAQTVTATLSGPLGAGDAVYGSLDNGATWTDVTAKVSGTTLGWTGATLAASSTLKLKVTDAAGNDGTVASQAYVLDSTAPAVLSVSAPADGSYTTGQALSFTVTTSEAVTVDTSGGTPRLALDVGGATVYARYASGSGSTALTFTYTVQPGDTDGDGIAVTALQANGGSLKDSAGNDMAAALHGVASTVAVRVDTTPVTVPAANAPAAPDAPALITAAPPALAPAAETPASPVVFLSPIVAAELGPVRSSPDGAPSPAASAFLPGLHAASTSDFAPAAPLPAALTQGGAERFQVVVVDSPGAGAAGGSLVLNHGIGDQQAAASGRTEISVPADAFAHTDPQAFVQLSARQANGQPLPDWVSFDAREGKFVVRPPAGLKGELAIQVVARDAKGHEAVSVFKLRVGAPGAAHSLLDLPSGRLGLSDQLRAAAATRAPARPGSAAERIAQAAEVLSWRRS